jgi:phosphatidylglycerophosphatase GEP4
VGDRIFTDVVLANRMRMQFNRKRQGLLSTSLAPTSEKTEKEAVVDAPNPEGTAGPLAIWTTGVWEHESMLMRWMERGLVNAVERWSTPPMGEPIDTSPFLKDEQKIEPPKKSGILVALLSRIKRA